MEAPSEKFYRPLEAILLEVNNHCIRMDDELKARYRLIAITVVEEIINLLKVTSPVFSTFFSRLDYVGSYYDGLRVKAATEFDLNIIIKLPLLYNKIKVENTNAAAGYVKLNISDAKKHPRYVEPASRVIEKWCDDHGNLRQNMVRSWFEGVITKTLNTEYIDGYRVKLKKSGPAFTLMIFDRETEIDVDLVLTLEFGADREPPSSIRWIPRFAAPWVVVPKPLDSEWNKDLLWRISFPASEKRLTQDLQKLKYINRFLKALRDAQLMNIASYYIKTVFLWEAHAIYFGQGDKKFWEKNKGFLFVYGLNKLKDYLKDKKLPFYWHNKLNLFSGLSGDNLVNMANRLQNILNCINSHLEKKDIDGLKVFLFALFNVNNENLVNNYLVESSPESKSSESTCTIL